ncbi:response regulator transcription factor [candidate division KSB1 bacterium]|nr:response regulator transcription factor [candidate division KSB1 bacterium]
MKQILLIEDETGIAQTICVQLQLFGFEVTPAQNAQTALEQIRQTSFNVIILDWMLPDEDGPQLIPKIRQMTKAPVLMLTARSEIIDKIMGFEAGADDYLTKPFDMMELIARIKALIRRTEQQDDSQKQHALIYEGISLYLDMRRVEVDGKEIELTPTEFKILEIMIQKPGVVFSRNELIELVLGYDYDGYGRTLDSHFARLRNKIELDPKSPRYIKTIFGIGYKLGG